MRLLRALALIAGLAGALSACALDLGQDARFGNYGGGRREAGPEKTFDIASTKFGVRWFPTHLRWAPDGSHLLVSLCHVNQADYCRIGKYWLADKRWELLNLKPQTTYRWPSYAPDGKRMVVTVGPCNEQFACSAAKFVLTLLDADGGNPTELLKTIADKPSFSDDGRKIIYWRHTGGGGADVGMYDLDSGKEEKLTQVLFWGSTAQTGPPFFLPGGDRFIFSGSPFYWSPGMPEWRGTKLDEQGPNAGVIRYAWDRRNGPVTRQNFTQVELLWPDKDWVPKNDGSLDVSGKGEVLYRSAALPYKVQLQSGRYRGNVVKVESDDLRLLVLRPPQEDAPYAAVFLLPFGAQVAAISPNGKRVAFSEINPRYWATDRRLGLISLGDQSVEFIDWPRLELDPASAATSNSTAQ